MAAVGAAHPSERDERSTAPFHRPGVAKTKTGPRFRSTCPLNMQKRTSLAQPPARPASLPACCRGSKAACPSRTCGGDDAVGAWIKQHGNTSFSSPLNTEVLESLPVKLNPHMLSHFHHQLQTTMLKQLVMKDHRSYPHHEIYHGKECHADILNLGAAGNLEDLQMGGNFVDRRKFESWNQTDMVDSSWENGVVCHVVGCLCSVDLNLPWQSSSYL